VGQKQRKSPVFWIQRAKNNDKSGLTRNVSAYVGLSTGRPTTGILDQ